MTRAGNYSGSLCLLLGAFARYLRSGVRKFRRSPGGWITVAPKNKSRQIGYFFVVGLNPIGWEGLRACGTLIDNAAMAW